MPRLFCLMILLVIIPIAHALDKSLSNEERSPEWMLAFEKLRTLPRPGELRTAGILANVGDVIETTPEQKVVIAAALKEYDAALVRKAAQWQEEVKASRAEFEAKILAALPEARLEAAQKALALTHKQWAMPLEFEAKLRAEFIAKKEKAAGGKKSAEELDALRKEFQIWIRDQRARAQQSDAEVVKNLKAILDAKEGERLGEFDRNRVVPAAPKNK